MKLIAIAIVFALAAADVPSENEAQLGVQEINEGNESLDQGEENGKVKTVRRPVAIHKKGGHGGGSSPTPRPKTTPAASPYATGVCFRHHGCGLHGKRGERDRGISPIIAGVTRNQCCNKKSGVGSAWGT
ncbi:unnamed protein product, partial [Aphanomyces euteiches]